MNYKLIVLLVTTAALWYKPFYSVLLLLLFCVEYYNVIKMLYLIKTSKNYYRITANCPNFDRMRLIDIWFALCKINAFTRVYYFYTKKKIKIRTLFMFFIMYFLRIPFRLLKLTYYFTVSKKSFRTSLILLTLNSYDLARDLKIEVLNKKVHLNCNNLTKLSVLLLKNNKLLDKNTFCLGMRNLQKASSQFYEREQKYGKCEVKLAVIYDLYGNPISKIPHDTIVEKGTSIHATSNTRCLISINQRVDSIIPSLVKFGAVNPGTIITKGVSNIKTSSRRPVYVPNAELDNIKANHEEFAIDSNIRNYQIEKEQIFCKILQGNFKLDKNIDADLLRRLRYNEFMRDLNATDPEFFETHYEIAFKTLNNDDGIIL